MRFPGRRSYRPARKSTRRADASGTRPGPFFRGSAYGVQGQGGPVRVARGTRALRQQDQASETRAAPAAQAVELRKTYGTGQAVVHALAGVTVTFERGRFTAVMGPSGSGKSTLMHCMAGLDRPTSGHCFVGGLDVGTLDDAGLTQLRRDRIGFVFPSFNLVSTLPAAGD